MKQEQYSSSVQYFPNELCLVYILVVQTQNHI